MTQGTSSTPLPPAPRGGGCGRWALGCGATVVALLAVGAGLTWWFVGRPLVAAFQSVQQLEQMESLDRRLANRTAYTPPADGLLEERQVERLLVAQAAMRGELAGRAERLQRLIDEFDARPPEGVDLVLMARTYAELLQLVVGAVEAQAAALDAQGFSAGEYAWVRREVLRAAGMPTDQTDIPGLAGAFTGDGAGPGAVRPAALPPVPDANRALVERHRERLDDAFLILLGL